VLAGAHPDFATAERKMTSLKPVAYKPNPAARRTYQKLYHLYRQLHDSFGGLNKSADLSQVMKDLLSLKEKARV
jgi:L-ribulokinase